MSNYLIAVGSFSKIREPESVFLRESTVHEISIRVLNENHSIMIIEKSINCSNDNTSNHFFKGWFQALNPNLLSLGCSLELEINESTDFCRS